MTETYGKLDIAMIPGLPEQEAEAEAEHLLGARNLPEPQQSTSYADPLVPPHERLDLQGGDSHQVPWQGISDQGAADVRHLHYWVHNVTETIDRGFYGFNSVAWSLPVGVPVQILGLDELRPRAEIQVLAVGGETSAIYIGDRDIINSDSPQSTGIWLATALDSDYFGGGTFTYRARKELWAVSVGDVATIGITSYQSEPTEGALARQSKTSGKDKREPDA